MSTGTELYIGSYPVWDTTSYVDSDVMTIFKESDKIIMERKIVDRVFNKCVYIKNADELEIHVAYSTNVSIVKDRLNIMGYTLNKAKADFKKAVAQQLEVYYEREQSKSEEDYSSDIQFWEQYHSDNKLKIKLLEELTFKSYLETLSLIVNDHNQNEEEKEAQDNETPILKYINDPGEFDLWFGLPLYDVRCLLRIFLETVSDSEMVTQDITDVVDAGYYEVNEAVCDDAVKSLHDNKLKYFKTIVLTEGSTDKRILEGSLNLLYPHLTGYFSFMDFDTSNARGGAPALVDTLKSFMGAGIGNKVIAMFDNDTAACEALRNLKNIDIPNNLRILSYPRIEIANNYPTIGPSGISNLDVNGLAGSIEVYLGEDILKDGEDNLIPVRWGGYSEILKKYQGEIGKKVAIQSKFFKKLKNCNENPDTISEYDWSGIHLILNSMFTCFDDFNLSS